MTPLVIWGMAATSYAAFLLWYNGVPRPLTHDEIEKFISQLPKHAQEKTADIANLRTFLSKDDGREFIMANLVRLAPEPVAHPISGEKLPAWEMLQLYTKGFFSTLLRQGGVPAIAARSLGSYIDSWNVSPDPGWTIFGYMRYRSRRDMMKLAIDPEFQEAHPFKMAAIPTTFSFPTKPFAGFYVGPRVWVGLTIALIAALVHIQCR